MLPLMRLIKHKREKAFLDLLLLGVTFRATKMFQDCNRKNAEEKILISLQKMQGCLFYFLTF